MFPKSGAPMEAEEPPCTITAGHGHLGSFFLEPEDITSQNLGAIWPFSKAARLPWRRIGAQRAGFFKA
jgi:hypothetical protein